MDPVPVLVTISFSHYCEKARWALDAAGSPTARRRTSRSSTSSATFAALSGPLTNPPEQPVTSHLEMPRRYTEMAADYQRRPAGQFALRLYAEGASAYGRLMG
jgi:hypothetical protein